MADIDKDKPADSDLVSQYPQNERNSRTAIETILAVDHEAGSDTADDGKHTIVQLLAQTSVSAVAGQGAFYTKDVGSGVIELFYKDAAGNEVQLTKGGASQSFPSGTKMVFYQASAPTGWTQDTGVNDRSLRVVSGSGGSTNTMTSEDHTLVESETPAHNHGGSTGGQTAAGLELFINNGSDTYIDMTVTANTGAGWDSDKIRDTTNHSHSISSFGGGGGHNHTINVIDVIVATRD